MQPINSLVPNGKLSGTLGTPPRNNGPVRSRDLQKTKKTKKYEREEKNSRENRDLGMKYWIIPPRNGGEASKNESKENVRHEKNALTNLCQQGKCSKESNN